MFGYPLQCIINFLDSEPINEGLLLAKIFDHNMFNSFTVYLAIIYMITNLTKEYRLGKKVSHVELNVWQRTGQISDSLYAKFQRSLFFNRVTRDLFNREFGHRTLELSHSEAKDHHKPLYHKVSYYLY